MRLFACRYPGSHRFRCRERGASLVELSIVGFTLMLAGLFTLQLGLVYHAKTIVNYATFEAARAGAVNHGSRLAIKRELGVRLAPLQGGDGSEKSAMAAIGQSILAVSDRRNTKVDIINPTKEAFTDWQIRDVQTGEYFIPVSQLRHQEHRVGEHSGLSLRDANLLKLQVTHGIALRVPIVGRLMLESMKRLDRKHNAYYLRGRWPIQSVATVRMQSNGVKSQMF